MMCSVTQTAEGLQETHTHTHTRPVSVCVQVASLTRVARVSLEQNKLHTQDEQLKLFRRSLFKHCWTERKGKTLV